LGVVRSGKGRKRQREIDMEAKTFNVRIEGIRPLLMHNGQLADPLNEWTQALAERTKKKGKTLADHEEIGRVEFQGGLYWDGRPVVPATALDAMMKAGARLSRRGKQIEAGVEVMDDAYPLIYSGPTDRDGLWSAKDKDGKRTFADRRGVRVQRNVVIRTRPKFAAWALEFTIALWEFAAVNPKDVEAAIRDAGPAVGLFDNRPRFGLFSLASFEETKGQKRKAA